MHEISAFEHVRTFLELSKMSIWCSSTRSLYLEHDISAWSLYIWNITFQHLSHKHSLMFPYFRAIAQCIWSLNIARSLFMWHNLAHFGIPYFCPLNPCKWSNQDFQKGRSSNQGQFLPIKNHVPGHKHLYRWHVDLCNYRLLFNNVNIKSDSIHFANGSEQCVELCILRQ